MSMLKYNTGYLADLQLVAAIGEQREGTRSLGLVGGGGGIVSVLNKTQYKCRRSKVGSGTGQGIIGEEQGIGEQENVV